MTKEELDLYSDYLLSSFGKATATGLSVMVDGAVSHDAVTRWLSEREYTSKDLWRHVKEMVRKIERDDGVLIFDDTIQAKPCTDENDVISWHYDHVSGRTVKGINLLNALYSSGDVSIPVAFEVVRKPLVFSDVKTRKIKRASEVTKNEQLRAMVQTCVNNVLKFGYVLMDTWFSSKENFEYIRAKGKHFVSAIKDNRLVALSLDVRKEGRFQRVGELQLSDQQAVRGYLKGFEQEVLIIRRVFTNRDGSTATLNLVCSDLTLDGPSAAAIYQKRWKVEVFHKSLKSNAALAKSPTRRPTTQINHVFMAIYAVFKLECLKIKHSINHFALRSKIYLNSLRSAYQQLAVLQRA